MPLVNSMRILCERCCLRSAPTDLCEEVLHSLDVPKQVVHVCDGKGQV